MSPTDILEHARWRNGVIAWGIALCGCVGAFSREEVSAHWIMGGNVLLVILCLNSFIAWFRVRQQQEERMRFHADAVRSTIDEALSAAMKERSSREDFVVDPDDEYGRSVPRWALYERWVVFEAVTRERAKLGLGPVSMSLIVRAERSAYGHSDYQRKFVLGAVLLVITDYENGDDRGSR